MSSTTSSRSTDSKRALWPRDPRPRRRTNGSPAWFATTQSLASPLRRRCASNPRPPPAWKRRAICADPGALGQWNRARQCGVRESNAPCAKVDRRCGLPQGQAPIPGNTGGVLHTRRKTANPLAPPQQVHQCARRDVRRHNACKRCTHESDSATPVPPPPRPLRSPERLRSRTHPLSQPQQETATITANSPANRVAVVRENPGNQRPPASEHTQETRRSQR